MKIKRSASSAVFDTANVIVMVLLAFTTLYPFWNVLALSLAPPVEAEAYGLMFWPKHPTLSGFKHIFNNRHLLNAFRNSLLRTVIGTCVNVFMNCLVAYPLSKKYLTLRNAWTGIIVFTMFFSGGLIPTYLMINNLGMIDSFWVLVIPGAISTYTMIIVRNYFQSLPPDLEESARIEGANEVTILVRIIMPISIPIVATIALWSAVGHWNAWFDAMIYLRSESKMVLQLLLYRLITQGTTEMLSNISPELDYKPTPSIIRSAAIIFTTVPIIMVYPFAQRYFMKGIMIGSLKG